MVRGRQPGEAPFTAQDVRRTYKARDSWWTVFLVDPVAAPIVRLLANHTRVTPNQLSVTAFVLGLGVAAIFLLADWPLLALGGVVFYLAFYVDCIDGKIARLKGTGSAFGQWLDWIFDRVRGFVCTLALMLGQFLRTGEAWYLVLGMCLVFIETFRYLNSLHSDKVFEQLRARLAAARGTQAAGAGGDTAVGAAEIPLHASNAETSPSPSAALGRYGRFRLFLQRHRLRPHLWSGIEFQMFVLIVAPITGLVGPVSIGAGVLLVAFECAVSYRLWLTTRSFERRLSG
ncbi:MAG: CDP-alcohol phosphatidyltransferase family protein, partial [Streptosporangiales bacterium]